MAASNRNTKVLVYWVKDKMWSIVSESAVRGVDIQPGKYAQTKFQGKFHPSIIIAKDDSEATCMDKAEEEFKIFLNKCLMEEAPEDLEKYILEYIKGQNRSEIPETGGQEGKNGSEIPKIDGQEGKNGSEIPETGGQEKVVDNGYLKRKHESSSERRIRKLEDEVKSLRKKMRKMEERMDLSDPKVENTKTTTVEKITPTDEKIQTEMITKVTTTDEKITQITHTDEKSKSAKLAVTSVDDAAVAAQGVIDEQLIKEFKCDQERFKYLCKVFFTVEEIKDCSRTGKRSVQSGEVPRPAINQICQTSCQPSDKESMSSEMEVGLSLDESSESEDVLGISLSESPQLSDNEQSAFLNYLGNSVSVVIPEPRPGPVSSDGMTMEFCPLRDDEQSLTEDELGISLESSSSEDELGISLDEMSDHSNDFFNEKTLHQATNVNFVMDFESVRAKVKPPSHVNDFLPSEVSSGKKMKRKALSILSIRSALSEKCLCNKQCIKKLTFKNIRQLRQSFWTNSRTVRMQLLKYYISNSQTQGKFRYISVSSDLHVCSRAFQAIYRINKNTFSRAIDMNKRDVLSPGGKKPRDLSDKTIFLVNWLEDYGTYHGDRMPDSGDVLLPYRTKKSVMFEKYNMESAQCSYDTVSRTQFFKTWDIYFPHMKVKKTNSFSKCTTCTTLERQLEKTTCVETRARYRQLKEEHNERQMMERKYYYSKREASRKAPARYMSLIVDGMDQSKTNLPHFTGRIPKSINGADLLKTHITGVINHGHGGFYTFVDVNEYPHDPNLTINIILKTLKRTAEMNENSLSSVCYIQADNCARENKNRYVLAFCELLVAEKVFDEVHLSFLFVGHTHEDVDAAFSKVAEKLRTNEAETLNDLLNLIPKSQ